MSAAAHRHLAAFRRLDAAGTSSIEFALLLPLLLMFYGATVEVGDGMAAKRRLTMSAEMIGSVISQQTEALEQVEWEEVLDGGARMMQAVAASDDDDDGDDDDDDDGGGSRRALQVALAVVDFDRPNGCVRNCVYKPKVVWTAASGSARPSCANIRLVAGEGDLMAGELAEDVAGLSATVVVETRFDYRPSLGGMVLPAITLRSLAYYPTRSAVPTQLGTDSGFAKKCN